MGSIASAMKSSVPSMASPGSSLPITSEFGAVHMMTLAPPSACNAAAWSTFEPSMYSCAPSERARVSLEDPEESATARKPIAFAIWRAR